MDRCSSNKAVVSAFIKVELYIILIVLSVIGAVYIVSVLPIKQDFLKILVLGTLIMVILYLWYKTLLVLMRKLLLS